MDANFDIPHEYLKSIFSEYKINPKTLRILSNALPTIDNLRVDIPDSVDRLLIGIASEFAVPRPDVLLAGVDPWGGVALAKEFVNISGAMQGKLIFPDAPLTNLVNGLDWPLFAPLTGIWSELVLNGAGVLVNNPTQGLLSGFAKVRVDQMIPAGAALTVLAASSIANTTIYITLVFAEGKFKSGVK